VICRWCKSRQATLHFGDMLSFSHGGGKNCCELCATRMQLDHAEERAAELPELRRLYQELQDNERRRNGEDVSATESAEPS
jgi:protein-arginine kinase activator protein McsA